MCPQDNIEVLSHKSEKEAYSSVGGLSKQIEAIRDLLEIPLSRPDLFRYFGKNYTISVTGGR